MTVRPERRPAGPESISVRPERRPAGPESKGARWRPNPWCNREQYRMLPLVSGLKSQLATAGRLTLGLSPTVARVSSVM